MNKEMIKEMYKYSWRQSSGIRQGETVVLALRRGVEEEEERN